MSSSAPNAASARSRPRVLIAAGGTGGHVFPALALADGLRQCSPRCELLFVGSVGGLEQRLVPARGHRLELLHSAKLRGMGLVPRLQALFTLPKVTLQATWLLRRFEPHVVVGLGGYASAPVVVAAAMLRLPVVLLEQNAVPGTVNRTLARLARVVVVAHREAERHLPPGKALLLGNPIRPELVQALERGRTVRSVGEPRSRAERSAQDVIMSDGQGPTLLVLGGSQGAHAINELMVAAAPELVRRVADLRIVHQSGVADQAPVQAAYAASSIPARVLPFIEEMGPALRDATLVLGRSGATTLAELCAAGLPALLVPYPHAADDHQAANARELVQAGGAVMRRQETLDPGSLARELARLLSDSPGLERMSRAMSTCSHPDAAVQIAGMLLQRYGPRPGAK